MTKRRQALRSCEPLATSLFLALVLAEPTDRVAPDDMNTGAFLVQTEDGGLAFLSAVTLILWRYHRRDHASPRRIGRRI